MFSVSLEMKYTWLVTSDVPTRFVQNLAGISS